MKAIGLVLSILFEILAIVAIFVKTENHFFFALLFVGWAILLKLDTKDEK